MDVPRLIGMGRQPEDLEPYFGTGDAEYDPRLNISVGLSPACDEIEVEDRGESWVIQGKV